MKSKQLSRCLKVLSVERRVQILHLLKEGALCVNALACRLEVTPGAVSQHLRIMREADLVIDERRGYHIHYRLNEQTLARWRSEIDALLAVGNKTETTEGETPCHSTSKQCKTAKNPGT